MRHPHPGNALLADNDPTPVRIAGDLQSRGPFLLIGDHAGWAIPAKLGDLGLPPAERARHIAVDIGVEELGLALAERLAAPFLRQSYSRLVIDCNRDPADPTAMPEISDGTPVPGNRGLRPLEREARIEAISAPYHRAIADALDSRADAGLPTILISLHSFTPRMNGHDRPWHFGVLHDGHADAFARAVLDRLREAAHFVTADNEPYRMDTVDYTVPRHAFPRGLPYLELEVRQDLIGPGSDRTGGIADLLAEVFTACA